MSNTPPGFSKMDIATFIELGMLQEINRLFLHPLGMALSVKVDEDGKHTMGDVLITEDKTGVIFSDKITQSKDFQRKCEQIDNLRDIAKPYRMNMHGYFIQPRYKM